MTRIPFESLPSMSALFLDYVRDWRRVERFYGQAYSLKSIAEFARHLPPLNQEHKTNLCKALLEQQKRWGGESSSVEKLASGAVAVLTGQQPGLFTGPHYTVLKAITTVKLARVLEEMGVPAVPVFWIAGEDHDHDEISYTSILDRDAGLRKIEVELANGDSTPVGWLQLRSDVETAISDCLSGLPESEFQPEIRTLLQSAYRPGASPVDAFAQVMSAVFKGSGLILADPLDPELKRIAGSTLHLAVRQSGDMRTAVLARSRALAEAGYHEQVKVDENFTGLFALRGRSRLPMRPDELSTTPTLSPNVLLRPAVQDAIFPTAAYVGGPAEIAYFAQAGGVYDTLNRPMPPVFPRLSATLVEARVARALKKYEVSFEEALRGRDFLKRRIVEGSQGVEIFDNARDRISTELDSLRAALNAVDPTLQGALDTSRQKVLYQVETLRTRFINAEAARNKMLDRHLDVIVNSLHPEKKLQERVINVTSFLVRYGLGFIDMLEKTLDLDCLEHQVIEI